MHESWNHPSSEAIRYAKNRRKFRREAGRYRAKERGEDPDVAVPKRSPRHQPGEPGVSHHGKPDGGRKSLVAGMCTQCGRTDLKPLNKMQKMIREIAGLVRVLSVFLYSITPGMCPDCGIRVLPHAGAIRGNPAWPKSQGIPVLEQGRKEIGDGSGGQFRGRAPHEALKRGHIKLHEGHCGRH